MTNELLRWSGLFLAVLVPSVFAEMPVNVKGVYPQMTVYATGVGSNSETGIGAMIPWADKLWAVGYVAHIRGTGIGLYEISDDMTMKKHPESVTGTFANRLVHWESEQAIIGPHIIDAKGVVRTFKELSKHRLAATARHLMKPETMVYFLTMEGQLYEADVHTLESKQLFDLNKELDIPKGAQPHYKGAHAAQGRLVVANNTYEEPEYLGQRHAGRLAEWDGNGKWEIVEKNPFIEVSGKQNPDAGSRYGNTLFAVGWDDKSVIFRVLHDKKWTRYRLPQASHSWDHTWNTEWMRIREIQTERYIMDAFGMFYELPPLVYGGHIWGIKPICYHLRICPDMVSWRGMLVLAGDQTDNAVGQPQSGFWFGTLDELHSWGKPAGWGAVWKKTHVQPGDCSDPFLMTGFDKKVVHMSHDAEGDIRFTLEVDFLGNGDWQEYMSISVPSKGYQYHTFPDGFSAHWVRLKTNKECTATAQFMYN
ncbi:MAG: hypothetical protein L0Y36_04360 [Planctomycetales bacterium]|nr:hypothetical protein [Planctomycetales bacterium]